MRPALVFATLLAAGCGPVVIGYADEIDSSADASGTETTEAGSTSQTTGAEPSTTPEFLPDYVAAGMFNHIVASFDDGRTWTEFADPMGNEETLLEGITAGPDRIVVVGGFSTFVMTDGETWTSYGSNLGYARSVTYAQDMFVSVGLGLRVRSSDALGWIDEREPDLEEGIDLTGITYGDGRFVAIGKGAMSTSVDGRDWTTTPMADPPIVSVAYFDGRFVGVGYEGRVILTTDGVTIDEETVVPGPGFGSVCVYQGRLVAGIDGGGVRVSDDGLEWAEFASEAEGVACGEDSLVGLGAGGILRGADPISLEPVFESSVPLLTLAYTGAPGR